MSREIDALVARHVMELPDDLISIDGPIEFPWPDGHTTTIAEVDTYSESWSAAGDVVDRMAALGWGMVHWNSWPFSSMSRGHNVTFYRSVYPPAYGETWSSEGDMGRSFPLSCCLAALHALGVEVPQ